MEPYLAYMLHKKLPEDVVEARCIVRRSKAFVVVKEELYMKSISGSSKDMSPHKEGKSYYMTFTQESAVIMLAAEQ
jgi:hypothetical protein